MLSKDGKGSGFNVVRSRDDDESASHDHGAQSSVKKCSNLAELLRRHEGSLEAAKCQFIAKEARLFLCKHVREQLDALHKHAKKKANDTVLRTIQKIERVPLPQDAGFDFPREVQGLRVLAEPLEEQLPPAPKGAGGCGCGGSAPPSPEREAALARLDEAYEALMAATSREVQTRPRRMRVGGGGDGDRGEADDVDAVDEGGEGRLDNAASLYTQLLDLENAYEERQAKAAEEAEAARAKERADRAAVAKAEIEHAAEAAKAEAAVAEHAKLEAEAKKLDAKKLEAEARQAMEAAAALAEQEARFAEALRREQDAAQQSAALLQKVQRDAEKQSAQSEEQWAEACEADEGVDGLVARLEATVARLRSESV